MKDFLQNLLVLLAVCLCALVAFQWVKEVRLKRRIEELGGAAQSRAEAIRTLETKLANHAGEIQRLEALRSGADGILKSNSLELSSMAAALGKARAELGGARQEIAGLRKAVGLANTNILTQNETIRRQNERLLQLAEERNRALSNYHILAGEFGVLAEKWNRQQESLGAAGTNTAGPAGKKR